MFQHQVQHAWIRHIKDMLCCHGFGNIWNDQSVINEKVFLANFDQRLKDEFIQKCFSDIRDSDRCRLYKKKCRLYQQYYKLLLLYKNIIMNHNE